MRDLHTVAAFRFDPDLPWPAGVHAEIDKFAAYRRFPCVRVDGVCMEVAAGDWLLSDGDGNLYPVPAQFVHAPTHGDAVTNDRHPCEPPDYEPPTIDDLAVVKRGSTAVCCAAVAIGIAVVAEYGWLFWHWLQ